MPIQRLDPNRDLESYCVEHVEGVYKIYSDGAMVETMGYSGLGNLYNEAMKTIYEEEIARGVDIQSASHITSNIEFYRMLVEQLNQDNIAKVESQQTKLLSVRNTLEEEEQPLVKSIQRVITTINFCCRVDLEDGSIYIGEGYENISVSTKRVANVEKNENGYLVFTTIQEIDHIYLYNTLLPGGKFINEYFSINYEILNYESFDRIEFHRGFFATSKALRNIKGVYTGLSKPVESESRDGMNIYFKVGSSIGSKLEAKICITKTSTPKPFVKSMMPSGKLAFITNATSETHSFVIKNARHEHIVGSSQEFNNWYFKVGSGEYSALAYGQPKVGSQYINIGVSNISKVNCNGFIKNIGYSSVGIDMVTTTDQRNMVSFSQLLWYKGNFTQAELEGELAKDIKLIDNISKYY